MPFLIRGFFLFLGFIIAGIAAVAYLISPSWLWAYVVIIPLVILGIRDSLQNEHTILRNFPVIGHFRYIFEGIRPEINQYFVESDIDGRPFNRISRSIIYQRAKGDLDKEPFGTKLDFYKEGYDWLLHSALPTKPDQISLTTKVGGPDCTQPYEASILNVSAMSYGSLSDRAVMALNGGAKQGGFAQNTGEGGLSDYHLHYGGDLIWQIGTGYFGCRGKDGCFDYHEFCKNARRPEVKMIEVKLSQGAKPGQGGILPAMKNNEDIARARQIEPHVDVISPPYHTAFSAPIELLEFIQQLRKGADGKPVGFKLCIGHKKEFFSICMAMVETGIKPDFISIDGSEGGTGAAPMEFSNYVGMPIVEGLAFAYNALVGFELKSDIRLFAAGKAVTGFDIIRFIALGADAVYSGRAMMMAIGCIQALRCHNNTCPTGVTTHNPQLKRGLVVEEKKDRLENFHRDTIKSVKELMASAGVCTIEEIDRTFIERRVTASEVRRLDYLFPYIESGSLHHPPYPADLADAMNRASPYAFQKRAEPVYKG